MTQDQALQILKTGSNIFLTGEPGSGKTHTVNQYVSYLREHGVNPAITASTGIAATHISGVSVFGHMRVLLIPFNEERIESEAIHAHHQRFI